MPPLFPLHVFRLTFFLPLPRSAGHLVIPLIEFLGTKGMHTKEELGKGKLAVMFKTNMIDYAMEIYEEVHGKGAKIPETMTKKKDEVLTTLQELRTELKPLLDIVTDAGRVSELKTERCFNQAYLGQNLKITPQHIELLYRYAKFTYECGDYAGAGEMPPLLRQWHDRLSRSTSRRRMRPLRR